MIHHIHTIKDIFYITGRGIVVTVDLVENGIVQNKYEDYIPIHRPDIMIYKGSKYKILGVEVFRGLKIDTTNIGLNIRAI